MKIVFVLPDMVGGGTERVVALLANEYVKKGYETDILLFAGKHIAYLLDERVKVHIVGEVSGGNPILRLQRVINMRRFYKKNKDCCIFAFSVMGAVFSVVASLGIPCRMLVSERNDPTRYEHQKIRNWAYKKAEKIVLQTEDMRTCFPDKLSGKMVVIPNPVPDDIPEPYMGIRQKRVVSVARLQPQKNQKLLLDAFSQFIKKYPEYELYLFGVGILEKELKEQAKKLSIADKVIFKGFSSEVREKIRDSAMFVLSSDYEGISNSMIEALAMGIPVISTDCPIGGSRMYIQDHINGLLTPVGDADALCKAMCDVAGNEELAKKLSQNGAKIRETYHLGKIADRFLKEAGIG